MILYWYAPWRYVRLLSVTTVLLDVIAILISHIPSNCLSSFLTIYIYISIYFHLSIFLSSYVYDKALKQVGYLVIFFNKAKQFIYSLDHVLCRIPLYEKLNFSFLHYILYVHVLICMNNENVSYWQFNFYLFKIKPHFCFCTH